jgi:hypothetical protein
VDGCVGTTHENVDVMTEPDSKASWPRAELTALAKRWAAGDSAAVSTLMAHPALQSYVGRILSHETRSVNDADDIRSEVMIALLEYFKKGRPCEHELIGAVVRRTIARMIETSQLTLTDAERRMVRLVAGIRDEMGEAGDDEVEAVLLERMNVWASGRGGDDSDPNAKLVRSGMRKAWRDHRNLAAIAGTGLSLDVAQPSGDGTFGDSVSSDAPLRGTLRPHDNDDVPPLEGFLERLLAGIDKETVCAVELLADTDEKDRPKLGARKLAKASGLTQTAAGAIPERMLYRCSSPQQMWALFGPVVGQFETEPADMLGMVAQRIRVRRNG